MKCVSIDIETSGRDADKHQTLEIAAIVFDPQDSITPVENLPTFHAIFQHREIVGEPIALDMNAVLIRRIANSFKKDDPLVLDPVVIQRRFTEFLIQHKVIPHAWVKDSSIQVAGKNFSGFDRQFIAKWWPHYRAFHYREMNPAMLYFDRFAHDVVPSLATCCEIAGIDDSEAHTAVADARNVIHLLRFAWERDENIAFDAGIKFNEHCRNC